MLKPLDKHIDDNYKDEMDALDKLKSKIARDTKLSKSHRQIMVRRINTLLEDLLFGS